MTTTSGFNLSTVRIRSIAPVVKLTTIVCQQKTAQTFGYKHLVVGDDYTELDSSSSPEDSEVGPGVKGITPVCGRCSL